MRQLILLTCVLSAIWRVPDVDAQQQEVRHIGHIGIWDTRSSQTNVIECGNPNDAAITGTLIVWDNAKHELLTKPLSLPPLAVMHLLLEQKEVSNRFGTFIASTTELPIVCHTVVYKYSADRQLSYTYSLPAGSSLAGVGKGIFNGAHFAGGAAVANVLRIVAVGDVPLSGVVDLYVATGASGEKLSKTHFALKAGEQVDVPIAAEIAARGGFYTISPSSDAPYFAVLIRSSSVVDGGHEFAFPLQARCGTCRSGPVTISTLDGAEPVVEIANTTEQGATVLWDLRDTVGAVLDSGTIELPALGMGTLSLASVIAKPRLLSFHARLKGGLPGEEALLVQSVMYHRGEDNAEGIDWAYPSQYPARLATRNDKVVMFVNTYLGAESRNYYFEGGEVLSECRVDLYEEQGQLFAQDALRLLPTCNVGLDLHEQTGGDFIGVGIAQSDDPKANYAVELHRVYPGKGGKIGHIMNMRGVVIPRDSKLPGGDLAVLRCGSMGQVLGQGHVVSDVDRERQARVGESLRMSSKGHALIREKKFNDAVKAYAQAIAAYPNNICALSNLAFAYAQKGDRQLAEASFQRVLKLDRYNSYALLNLGALYGQSKQYDKAAQMYLQLLGINPTSPEANNWLGWAYTMQGRYGDAQPFAEKAVLLDPYSDDAHNNLGILYQYLGNHAKSLEQYEHALKLKPEVLGYQKNVGLARLNINDYEPAAAIFEQLLRQTPDDGELHTSLGWTRYKQGQLDEAVRLHRRSLELKPGYVQALLNLAIIYREQGRAEEALAQYGEVIKIDPKNAWGPFGIATTYFDQGMLVEALPLLKQAAELNRHSVEIHLKLAEVYHELGDTADAMREYEVTLSGDPNNESALRGLIVLNCLVGNKQAALRLNQKLPHNAANGPGKDNLGEFKCPED